MSRSLIARAGLLRAGLLQVAQIPACGPTCVLRPGGRARLQLPERAEHGVRGHGLQQRLPGAADLHRGSAGQLVSTTRRSGPAAEAAGRGPRPPAAWA